MYTSNDKRMLIVFLTWSTFLAQRLLNNFCRIFSPDLRNNTQIRSSFKYSVTLQAGIKGWESVFFEELGKNAQQVFGEDKVCFQKVDRDASYVRQCLKFLRSTESEYMLLDPRTFHDSGIRGFIQAVIMSMLLTFFHVVPIVFLTDASVIKWRIRAILLTANQGKILMLMKPEILRHRIPHNRTHGPIHIPISKSTLRRLDADSGYRRVLGRDTPICVVFVGTIYPGRDQYIEELNYLSAKLGFNFRCYDKSLGLTNQEYWNLLLSADAVLTTTMQTNVDDNLVDLLHENHMVFRISETAAAGRLILTTEVPGMDKIFHVDDDYVLLTSVESLEDEIRRIISNPEFFSRIAQNAHSKFCTLIETNVFWRLAEIPIPTQSKH